MGEAMREAYLFVHIAQDIGKAGEANRRGRILEAKELALNCWMMAGELAALISQKAALQSERSD